MTARFKHQEEEYRRHRFSVARALLWSMRTGKTRMAVESARALFDAMEIRGVLVIAPNGVHRQWTDEQIHKWDRKSVAFAWRFSNPENSNLFKLFLEVTPLYKEERIVWLCVNMEVIHRKDIQKIITQFKAAVGRAMLIIDESHHMARAGSKRTAVTRGLGRKFEYRRILSGTVAEEAPEQTFSQYEILDRGALGHTTYGGSKEASRFPCPTCGPRCRGFKNEFCEFEDSYAGGHQFKVISGHKNLDVLKERMARYSSVVLRSDCEDLPALMCQDRIAEMEGEQLKYWNMIADQEIEESEKRGIDKVWDGGSALVKLQQIEGGFFKMPDKGETRDLCGKSNPKMLILNDEIMQYDGQVVCWFAYTHELEAAYEALTGAKVTCGRFHGKRGTADRDKDLNLFLRGKLRTLLAQPAAGGEGRDFSAAGKMLYYSQVFSARVRAQSMERATKMGGTSVQVVDLMTPTSRYIRDQNAKKSSVAEDVARNGLRRVIEGLR